MSPIAHWLLDAEECPQTRGPGCNLQALLCSRNEDPKALHGTDGCKEVTQGNSRSDHVCSSRPGIGEIHEEVSSKHVFALTAGVFSARRVAMSVRSFYSSVLNNREFDPNNVRR